MKLSPHASANRSHWNESSDDYQARHGDQLARKPRAWGVWALPEDELCILGDVAGKDDWSSAVVRRNGRLPYHSAVRDARGSIFQSNSCSMLARIWNPQASISPWCTARRRMCPCKIAVSISFSATTAQ
jgi:hypothetical protein